MLAYLCLHADSFSPLFGSVNINANYLDWSHSTEEQTQKGDFLYAGIEGIAVWQNVSFYGFVNVENPFDSYDEQSKHDLRFSTLADIDIALWGKWKLHLQNYAFYSGSFYVNDAVAGVGYRLEAGSGVWARPFLGVHHTYSTYYNALNGYMGGWLINYDFTVASMKCNLFNWHEIEFGRKRDFYLDENSLPVGDGRSWGYQGALTLSYYPTKRLALALGYRYADNKLGSSAYQSALIYTVKFYF